MPVTFKGESEYHKNFKWMESPKSATFTPTRQQSAPTAGISSPKTSLVRGFQNEPPILRKKKPIPLVTTSTTKMFDEDIVVPDDYMLLGSQEKFTPNIQYRDYLTKNRSRVLGTTYVAPAKPADFKYIEPQPSKPLAKINFDTGAPRNHDLNVENEMEVNGVKKSAVMSKTRVIAREPVTPVSLTSNGGREKKQSSVSVQTSSREDVKKVDSPSQTDQLEQVNKPKQVDKPKQRLREFRKQDEGIDDTYAMKYRAGISPQRQNKKRRSEYAYKFDWKKPIESTPLLAAEQIVHNNNPQIGPYKDNIKKKSEYQKEFRAWKYKPITSQDDASVVKHPKTLIKGSKLRRSRSEAHLTPDRRPAAGSPSRMHHDNQRLTQSLNPQKPFFPLRRTVSWTSEYKSNFQPFNNYKYKQGAWRGAAPPHVKQKQMSESLPTKQSLSWFSEVKELRDKAEEYRKRSLGTHFSRAHVAQLLSDNSKLWDAVSVSSDLSALDLEQSQATAQGSGSDEKRKKKSPRRERTQSAQARPSSINVQEHKIRDRKPPTPRKRLAWSSDGSRSTSVSDSVRSIRSSSIPPVSLEAPDGGDIEPSEDQESDTTDNGRVQTPEIVQSPTVRRHHLDITTPNRHGLLLASPPHKDLSLNSSFDSIIQTNKQIYASPAKVSPKKKPKDYRPKEILQVDIPDQVDQQLQLSPTYGKPTLDTHPLLNEDIPEPVDAILETRYVQSPQPKVRNLSTLAEDYGMTYNVPSAYKRPDEDAMSDISQLSNSMMSVISTTSSLASDTLKRAAKRQKEFWGSKNQ